MKFVCFFFFCIQIGKCTETQCGIVCVSSDDLEALCAWLKEKGLSANGDEPKEPQSAII